MESSPYITLVKNKLIARENISTYEIHPLMHQPPTWKNFWLYPLDSLLRKRNFTIRKLKWVDPEKRLNGYDWPAAALTMIGLKRLENIEHCMRNVIVEGVPGDVMETGVWRGGATILMRALLLDMNIRDRKVWVADSFRGIPPPEPGKYPADKVSRLHRFGMLAVPLAEVKKNFSDFGLLDDQVVFLEGWFRDSLPSAPVKQLAVLRLDGDLYGSTIEALRHLYPKLSAGGYLIIDDYNAFPFCKQAADDYRKEQGITDEIIPIDEQAAYWKKSK